jgi:hypothetical protein
MSSWSPSPSILPSSTAQTAPAAVTCRRNHAIAQCKKTAWRTKVHVHVQRHVARIPGFSVLVCLLYLLRNVAKKNIYLPYVLQAEGWLKPFGTKASFDELTNPCLFIVSRFRFPKHF